MEKITLIHAEIISKSPLYIGNDEKEVLINNEEGKAYLPATSIAGSFRAYLKSINEDYKKLFGDQSNEGSIMSNLYISDAFAEIERFDRRNRVSIDGEKGSGKEKHKIDELYLSKGLKFNLAFEIHNNEKDESLNKMLYKCLEALNRGIIRFGSNKSNGLGVFEVTSIKKIDFHLKNIADFERYLKKDYSDMKEIKGDIFNKNEDDVHVEFIIEGEFTTPLLIKAPETFEIGGADGESIKSGSEYLIPGSSFKGVLRSRIERIAKYFGSLDKAKEMFGVVDDKDKKNSLSQVFVNESIIDNKKFENKVRYNRIKIDRFTGGARNTALMDDIPVKGETEFKVIYKRKNDDVFDKYAIGIILLALRDMGTENLAIGSGNSIGRGRFKANTMDVVIGNENIKIDFNNKTISNQEQLNKYVEAVKTFMRQEGKND
jgi:CRISPR/Cas system CSM-associated protein Csm3 (group 7 of RAMP superfamily)